MTAQMVALSASADAVSHPKLRIHNTPLENIISNLRGEIGEVTFSWVLMRGLLIQSARRAGELGLNAIVDREIDTLDALIDRLEADIISRLSELAEMKIGRLTFHFASRKLGDRFERDVLEFNRFVKDNGFVEKRNAEISHKELPEQWSTYAPVSIPHQSRHNRPYLSVARK